jgi:hypothetical protein
MKAPGGHTPDAPGRAGDELQGAVLDCVREHGPISGRGVTRRVHRRQQDVRRALYALECAGAVVDTREGWKAAGTHRDTPQMTRDVSTTDLPYRDRTCPTCRGLLVNVDGTLTCYGCRSRGGAS